MFMLLIVGRRNLRQQAGYHLDDVLDLHLADLILWAFLCTS